MSQIFNFRNTHCKTHKSGNLGRFFTRAASSLQPELEKMVQGNTMRISCSTNVQLPATECCAAGGEAASRLEFSTHAAVAVGGGVFSVDYLFTTRREMTELLYSYNIEQATVR